MSNSICHIEICTTNLPKAEKFYGELFGWKIQSDVMDGYSLFEASKPPGGGLQKVEKLKSGDGIIFYVLVDSIENTLKKAKTLGAKVVKEKSEIPNIGWYGVFSDLDGNRIGIYKSLQ